MNHKTLFTASAIVLLIFGLAWLIIPDIAMGLFGISPLGTAAGFITRYWGSAFFGVSVLQWLSRKAAADSIGVRAIIIGGFVLSFTGLLVSLGDAFWGVTNNLIWLSVALYAIFAIWNALLMFKK